MDIHETRKASLQDDYESDLEESKTESAEEGKIEEVEEIDSDQFENSFSDKSTSLELNNFSGSEDSELEYDGILPPFNSLENSIVFDEVECETPKLSDQVADKIISFFKVKRPVRFIDKETAEDEVSYEESEIRLIILLSVLATVFALVSTGLAFTMKSNKQEVKSPWNTIPNSSNASFPTFNFIVIDSLGNLESLQLQNENTFKLNYKMKLPGSLADAYFEADAYFAFAEKGEVYIVKSKGKRGEGKKQITQLSSNGKHRVIGRSEVPQRFTALRSGSFRIDKYFLVFGYPDMYHHQMNFEPIRSWIWSINKQRWFKGFSFANSSGEIPCGVPLNRTFGIIFHEGDFCIRYHLFKFDPFAFTSHPCFMPLFFANHLRSISCTSFIGKNGTM